MGGYMESILKVDNLNYAYKDRIIFENLSLNIKKSEWVCICGCNGCGKSTLIKILTGIIKTDENITVCNYNLKTNLYDVRRNIGVVFSDIDNMFLCETVRDDLIYVLENLGFNTNEIDRRIDEVSKYLGIGEFLDLPASFLSGGEKSLCALGIAIVGRPRILFLDEAFSMIDNSKKIEIFKYLKKLNKDGLTIVNVTHDLSEAYFCDRVIVISNKRVILSCKPVTVFKKDKVLKSCGIGIPFEIELSSKLMLYGLIPNLEVDIRDLVEVIWK